MEGTGVRMASVGVLIEHEAAERRWKRGVNVFQVYIEEILAHAGIPYERVGSLKEVQDRKFDLLICALAGETKESGAAVRHYAEGGGTVIAYGGLNGLAGEFGYCRTGKTGAGYASFPAEWQVGSHVKVRYLDADLWAAAGSRPLPAQAIGRICGERPDGADRGPLIQRFSLGKGYLDRWSVDVPDTIVRMQQGAVPVVEDGVPAPDGSAAVNDGILKADDAVAMSWSLDRRHTETGKPYFACPYADYWREALVAHLIRCALERGLTLPFVGYWPDGVDHVAMISHDSDHNQDAHALAALSLLEECGVHSTWCMLEPGYSKEIYEQVNAAGHELAFHYNALEAQGGEWSEPAFVRQIEWLKRATGLSVVTSNKNHYTRFEGWDELFDWCEKHGIASDQTRGPSKKGNVGFLFGTCHPYFPIAWADRRNRFFDVLEIGFLTQDLNLPHLSDAGIIRPLLERAAEVGGVAHFLFHQTHIHSSPSVRDAFRQVVAEARRLGFPFWTGRQVNDWVRARRKVRIVDVRADGAPVLNAAPSVPGLVVWVPVPENTPSDGSGRMERKFGVPCRKTVVSPALESV
jgi:hypothetical protein